MQKHRFSLLALALFVVISMTTAHAQRGTPYNYILQVEDYFETVAGMPSGSLVVLFNPGSYPVTLTVTVSGAPEFLGLVYDTSSTPNKTAQIDLPGNSSLTVFVAFQAATTGDYTGMLTVTDGTLTDQVIITVHVLDPPGNFMAVAAIGSPMMIPPGILTKLPVWVVSMVNTPLTVSATLSGPPEFTLGAPSSFTLDPYMDNYFEVEFLSSTLGKYTATLYVTDGVETDTVPLVVEVATQPVNNYYSFTVETDGWPGGVISSDPLVVFELPDSLVRHVNVTNISSNNLDFKTSFDWNTNFTVSDTAFSLTPSASKTLTVTYTGPVNIMADDVLWLHASPDQFITLESMPVFCFTMPPVTNYTGGLEVPWHVDFGIVDTNTTKCEDILITNTTNAAVTISNIALSGYSQDFSFQNMASPVTIPANGTHTITVCYRPSLLPFQEYEVMTFDYDSPTANPRTGMIWVDLTGMPSGHILCPTRNGCLMAWFQNWPVAPIGSESEFSVLVENLSDSSVTLQSVQLDEIAPTANAFTLLTQLPVTVSVMDPALPGSGQAELKFKYTPSSPGSMSGTEDFAMATFTLNRTACGEFALPLIGMAEDSITQRKMNPLYPPRGESPVVGVEGAGKESVHEVTFYNNLKTPVTVTAMEIQNGTNFTLDGLKSGALPVTLAPDEELVLVLELQAPANDIYNDKLTIRSSHEHLNKEFEIHGVVDGITGMDDVPAIASQVLLSVAPNPAAGPLTATLSGAKEARFAITDLMGRTIAEYRGESEWQWDGVTQEGMAVQPGTYFIRATGTNANGSPFSVVRRAVILK